MDYVSIFLAGVVLGIFACMTLYALIVAFRPSPPTMYRRRVDPPPNMAQVPVHEAGSVSYEFINITGLEK